MRYYLSGVICRDDARLHSLGRRSGRSPALLHPPPWYDELWRRTELCT